jgi:transposase
MANKRELEAFVLQQQQMQFMLQDMYTALERTNVSLQELIAQKDAEIARLNEIISNLKRNLFGQKSEKTAYVLDGQPMLPFETAKPNPSKPEKVQNLQPEPVQVPVHAHHRTKRTLEERFEALPVVEEVLDIPEDCKIGHDGCPLEPIGKEFVRSEIIRVSAKCYHKKIYRKTYIDRAWEAKTGETRIRKSAIPVPLIEKSYASASLVTGILIQKYVDGMPLYRMEQMYKREGLPLTRATMANWVITVVELYLLALYIRLCNELTRSTVIHADETPLQVLKEQGRPATAQSRMWVYATSKRAEKQIRCFDYQETRSGDCAVQFLENFQGVLISDGYSGYNKLKNVTRAGCWAHLRRKWREAMPKGATIHNSLSAIGFDYCNKLFKLEENFETLDDNERRHKRQMLAKPLLDEYWNWLENIGSVSGKLKDAVTYSKTQRKYLETFLEHGEIEISNNQVENAIRPFVIGRKGWLFSDTPRGAIASAVVYSLMETAKANGLNVNEYILYLLTTLPEKFETDFVVDDYLPWANEMQKQFKMK